MPGLTDQVHELKGPLGLPFLRSAKLFNSLHSQRGFTLIDVMCASMVLSIFILGIGAFWVVGDRNANDLVLREKALLVANGELERLSSLYNHTTFGTGAPATTTGYEASSPFATTRLTYPTTLDPLYTSAGDDFVVSSLATFTSTADPLVWVSSQLVPALNRSYVWLDRSTNVLGRISWIASNITPSQCVPVAACVCLNYLGIGNGSCQRIDFILEYPFRLVSGAAVAGSRIDSISLRTIVGRRTR
jgi:Tfp pilus assembly protein PilV